MVTAPGDLAEQVRALGPWFHNLRLGDIQTAPAHPLGDFPSTFWQHFRQVVPEDLRGQSVLDIGCNGGFYSFEMHRRGARRVLGVDHDPVYLAQARFARDYLGIAEADVELRELDAYHLDSLTEQFDLVLFMGVLYHLRHPLYALEKVAQRVRPSSGTLIFQTMERGSDEEATWAEDYPITEQSIFWDPRFPKMAFVEHRYAGDPTNWWVPNAAASQAMLRSCGLRIVDRPCHEVYVCHRPDDGGAGA